jgi:hypothetical protein
MTARTQSLVPLHLKLLAGFVAFVVLAANFNDGGKNEDKSDPDKYRIAAIHVSWQSFSNTRPTMEFTYRVGTNGGIDSSKTSPFVAAGPTAAGEGITMFASVVRLDFDRVVGPMCQAYVDGNPVHTDQQMEAGKWIRCWALVTW